MQAPGMHVLDPGHVAAQGLLCGKLQVVAQGLSEADM